MPDSPGRSETKLYASVKRFLEAQGFVVKGEVCGCDIVAIRAGEPEIVVIVELKLGFNLELVLQAVDRMTDADAVWLAVPATKRGRDRDKRAHRLCRLLGLGLLAIGARGLVEVLAEPLPYRPRADRKQRQRLVREHTARRGDPTPGGSTRQPIMTAYRQQALDCARILQPGPCRLRDVRATAPDAGKILRRNVYGWFTPVSRGIYGLTEAGEVALARWPSVPD
jgi:hypothetical protein